MHIIKKILFYLRRILFFLLLLPISLSILVMWTMCIIADTMLFIQDFVRYGNNAKWKQDFIDNFIDFTEHKKKIDFCF